MLINLFVFQTPDGDRFAKEIGLERGIVRKDVIFLVLIQFQTVLTRLHCLAVLYFPFGLSPKKLGFYCVASNLNTQNALKISFKVIM